MKRLCENSIVQHVLNFGLINESEIKLRLKKVIIYLYVYISVVLYIIICYYDPRNLVKPYKTCVI